ncbi:MAG: LuxR C-terminal-related transcriptional regulator [Syntrophobacter sp.]
MKRTKQPGDRKTESGADARRSGEHLALRSARDLFQDTILDSLTAHIAILDENGVIIKTNRAWMAFACSNQIRMRPDTLSINYLALCDCASGDASETAHGAGAGIRGVIAGLTDEFVMEYPCHSPSSKLWFNMRVTRFVEGSRVYAVVSHENITTLKLAEEALRNREAELAAKSSYLADANAALRVLLKQREDDKFELEEQVLTNLKKSVLPYIEKLKRTRLALKQEELIETIELHLDEIVSPFIRRLSSEHLRLTPAEIQVASLIRDGKATKEIAEVLGVSTSAIDFHRHRIRKKLGLTHNKANLRSHLLSLLP